MCWGGCEKYLDGILSVRCGRYGGLEGGLCGWGVVGGGGVGVNDEEIEVEEWGRGGGGGGSKGFEGGGGGGFLR